MGKIRENLKDLWVWVSWRNSRWSPCKKSLCVPYLDFVVFKKMLYNLSDHILPKYKFILLELW